MAVRGRSAVLTPRSRRLLLEALRPPPGCRLDRAIGTSYSLDLLALLTAPLAFTFFDWEDGEGRPTTDPIALLEAVRRHADRITLFCQTGRIGIPRSGQTLLLYLEGSVVEVTAPREGGIFHPKIWLLRYVADDGLVRYRLLCLSRNLTFSQSWDTALVLDGVLEERSRPFAANHGLGDFVAALPGLTIRPVSAFARESAELMATEIRRVRFELPEGFDGVSFWPLGLSGRKQWPFPEASAGRCMAIVSPFLSPSLLERLSDEREPGVVISRPESLAELAPDVLARFREVFVLTDTELPSADEEPAPEAISSEEPLTGLHAKLFVMDDGWDARVWTGSANATDAAFSQNVEFLVELRGKKSICGIDVLLGSEGESGASLRDMLCPFQRGEAESTDGDVRRALEKRLDQTRVALGRAGLIARVTPHEDGETFGLTLIRPGRLDLDPKVEITCRPISLATGRAVTLGSEKKDAARFERLTFDALTGFVAFELRLSEGEHEERARFVLNLPLEGAPPDRRERLLQSILRDADQVMRLIWLLLAGSDVSVHEFVTAGTGVGASPTRKSGTLGFPLLETMLKALDRDPKKLDEVARLVADLRRTPEGAALLPQDFDVVWQPIWQIREELRR